MEYKYIIKEPDNCLADEIEMFRKLVIKAGKVELEGLSDRILNCKLLAFCYDPMENLIAISSIKKPQKSYVEKVIKKANLDRLQKNLQFELGYSFTEIGHRRNGINSHLKQLLLNSIKTKNCLLFCTTANPTSQSFLLNNGFIFYGNSYDGENDNKIKYYEKKFGNFKI